MTFVQPIKLISALIAGLCACTTQAKEAQNAFPDGWSGFFAD